MRRVWNALVGLAIALLVTGLALAVLTQPFFTRTLSGRFSLAEEAGLSRASMLGVAEQVRAFVVSPESSTLPDTIGGRPAFDVAAVAHLIDVREVIASARVFTWSLAILLALWLGSAIFRRRRDSIVGALRAGALWCATLVVIASLAGLLDFEALFTSFHGLFFAEGTWTFAYDSLLIQAFPEPFWATAAGAWAGLVLLGAALLALGAWVLSASWSGTSSAREQGPSGNGA